MTVALAGSAVTAAGPSAGAATAKGSGPVDVLYAGSLVTLMQNDLGPAFQKATGYSVSGVSAGSTQLASEIKGGTQVADVFISAAPSVNSSLQGSANGNWVSWYATFATSPLVLGYNPKSSFAKQIKTEPWYRVITSSGFLLGRTDPATDPKGVLAVTALNQAAKRYNEPALKGLATTTGDVYPEETMVGRLQANQLDAGFFYTVEATAAGIPTVPLTGINKLEGVYTVTVVNRAPHAAAARAFVAFLLGPKGRAIMKKNGLVPVSPPKLSGAKSVPSGLRQAVS